jgi:hypothetical protein
VSVDLALQQLESNLSVIAGVLGPGVVRATRAQLVPVDAARNLFGLRADLRVRRLADVRSRFFDDIRQGSQVGLVGGIGAVVEGLAIDVVDDAGHRASAWMSARGGMGSGAADPELDTGPYLAATGHYPNLTGGPGLAGASSGGIAQPSTGLRLVHAGSRLTARRRDHSVRLRVAAPQQALKVTARLTRAGRTLARGTWRFRAGQARTVKLRLTARAWRQLRATRKATLRVTAPGVQALERHVSLARS